MGGKQFALCLLLSLLPNFLANIRVDLKLTDYINPQDRKSDGNTCERWYNDFCDPKFDICLGDSSGRCNVISSSTAEFKNQKMLSQVFSGLGYLYVLPERLFLKVKVHDVEMFSQNELIAIFEEEFEFKKVSQVYSENFSSRYFAGLSYSIQLSCDANYYGPKCGTKCISSKDNYSCDPVSGNKLCILNCKNEGFCMWTTNEYMCVCGKNWRGKLCDQSLTPIQTTSNYQTTKESIESSKPVSLTKINPTTEIDELTNKKSDRTSKSMVQKANLNVDAETKVETETQKDNTYTVSVTHPGKKVEEITISTTSKSTTLSTTSKITTTESNSAAKTMNSQRDQGAFPSSSFSPNLSTFSNSSTGAPQTIDTTANTPLRSSLRTTSEKYNPDSKKKDYNFGKSMTTAYSGNVTISKGKLLVLLCLSSIAVILSAILVVAIVWRILFPKRNRIDRQSAIEDDTQKCEYTPSAAIWKDSFEYL